MKIRIFLLGILLLTALSSVTCSDEAEFSSQNYCEMSGGHWQSDTNTCKCEDIECPSGVACLLQDDNYLCANLPNDCEISGGKWKDSKCICGKSTCETGIVCVKDKTSNLDCAYKAEPTSSP